MKYLLFPLILIASSAQAAIIYVTEAPASLTAGQSVEWTVALQPEGGDVLITGFQLNVGFSDWLTPGPVTELGYFAANGVFFFDGLHAPDSITFISDALPGSGLPPGGTYPLIKIVFTATQDGVPDLFLFDPVIPTFGGTDAQISSIQYTAPVIIDAPPQETPVPEPSSLILASSTLAAFAIRRWRTR